MADWALVIGINKYERLRSLNYAERDAALMRDFFQNEARFEQIFYFSDTSPDFYAPEGSRQSTRPTYGNLRSFLHDFFEESYLQAGGNFWFFFSGHGIHHQDQDYLMPCDANPRDVEYTGISISYVTKRLRRCGADNVVLLLDACRHEGDKAGLGIGLEKQHGVITICSCSPWEKSYEIEEIKQGAFTYALLESLRIQGEGNCATVERLYQRLRYRVAEINRYYNKPEQTPYVIIEPEVELLSEKNVDYTRLRNLLEEGNWKEADQETRAVMIKATGKEKKGYLDIESIEKFPCTDLRTIDRLWVKYSNERFGFSIQKSIWESVVGTPGFMDVYYYENFGDLVGWRVLGKWLEYSEITFSRNAQEGHLPRYWWIYCYVPVYRDRKNVLLGRVFFSRVETCKF